METNLVVFAIKQIIILFKFLKISDLQAFFFSALIARNDLFLSQFISP